jgi:membrane fusion protein, multidrug efflux system
MKVSIKWLLAIGFVLLAASVLLRTYSQIRNDPDTDEDEEAIKMPSRVSTADGQTVITLDATTQRHTGIAVARLRAVDERREVPAAATVLATQSLVALRDSFVAAQAQLEKEHAQFAVSRHEYQRVSTLYKDNQNASQKALQAALGVMQTDRANLDAARKLLRNSGSAVEQSWGDVVANWMVNDAPKLASVLDQKAMLVQVTLPPVTTAESPPRITLSTPSGDTLGAVYVSPFPRVDPLIQGISELYLARGYPVIEPGMNLVARLPVGRRRHGVLVPRAAVVWWQGMAWVYEQAGPTRFIRREAPTDTPMASGFFAASGFRAGDAVVVRGAQFLLSEEFRSQIQPED